MREGKRERKRDRETETQRLRDREKKLWGKEKVLWQVTSVFRDRF